MYNGTFIRVYYVLNDYKYSTRCFLQAFGTSAEQLDHFLVQGIINWGAPVKGVLEDGRLLSQQAKSSESSGLVSVLLEGNVINTNPMIIEEICVF